MFRHVPIDEAWPQIEPVAMTLLSVEECEILRDACRDGRALCLGCDEGLLVVHPNINPRDGTREYHCWWGHGNEGVDAAFEKLLPTIIRDARALGCPRIVYDTRRPGMLRKGTRAGFYVRNIEMVYDVPVQGDVH